MSEPTEPGDDPAGPSGGVAYLADAEMKIYREDIDPSVGTLLALSQTYSLLTIAECLSAMAFPPPGEVLEEVPLDPRDRLIAAFNEREEARRLRAERMGRRHGMPT